MIKILLYLQRPVLLPKQIRLDKWLLQGKILCFWSISIFGTLLTRLLGVFPINISPFNCEVLLGTDSEKVNLFARMIVFIVIIFVNQSLLFFTILHPIFCLLWKRSLQWSNLIRLQPCFQIPPTTALCDDLLNKTLCFQNTFVNRNCFWDSIYLFLHILRFLSISNNFF